MEDVGKEYRNTMQEIMIELEHSTSKFFKKFKEKHKKSEFKQLEIPMTISLKGDHRELEIDLFGIGDKIDVSEILEYPNLKNTRLVNRNTTIMEGVTLSHGKNQWYKGDTVENQKYVDYSYILFISKNVLSLEVNRYTLADWLFKKIKEQDCKIIIKGKEITNREELQTVLNTFITSNH